RSDTETRPTSSSSGCRRTSALFSAMAMRLVLDGNGLDGGETVQGLEAFFAPVSRLPGAAERQFNPAACTVVVDDHLSGTHGAGHAHLTGAVLRPDTCHQAEGRAVGNTQRFGFGIEGDGHQHRPENFFL